MGGDLQKQVDRLLQDGMPVGKLLGKLTDEGYLLSGVPDGTSASSAIYLTNSPGSAIFRATMEFNNGILIYKKNEDKVQVELKESYNGGCSLKLGEGYVTVFSDKGLEPVASIKVNCGDLQFPLKLLEWEKPLHFFYR